MKRTLTALALLTATGCAPVVVRMEPMASHTLRSGPDTDVDVVWVETYDPSARATKLYRCRQGAAGPECQLATVGQ